MNEIRFGGYEVLPPVIKNLLIINGLFFLATITLPNLGVNLNDLLGLHYFKASLFRPYQFITYMFMHGGFSHLFFNMFALWMFGSALELVWGPKRFLIYYFVTGIGAGIVQIIVFHFQINAALASADFIEINKMSLIEKAQFDDYLSQLFNVYNVVGASGAVYGILLAFGMIFPNSKIYIYFALPIKAKFLVIIYGVIELISGFKNSTNDPVAHFAHLGGMIFGLIVILFWFRTKRVQRQN